MTLTIEVTPETEQVLNEAAARLGVPLEKFAADALEDAADRAECERVRAEVPPSEMVPWHELKAEAGL